MFSKGGQHPSIRPSVNQLFFVSYCARFLIPKGNFSLYATVSYSVNNNTGQ
jgi:hypothetical protein